jgi:AraC-like DNA-binding protein
MQNTESEFILEAKGEHHHAVMPFARCVYIEAGGAWVRAGRTAFCVMKGDAVWLPPALPHALFAMIDTQVREFRIFPREEVAMSATVGVVACSPLLAAALRSPIRHEADPARTEALALLLLDEFALAAPRRRVPILDMPPASSRAASFCEMMLKQPTRDTTLAEVAAEVGVSIRTLNRIFREELNTSVAAWRREAQLGRALCALENDIPVSEVADMLGFTNSAFSTFFKSRLGYSPRHAQGRR